VSEIDQLFRQLYNAINGIERRLSKLEGDGQFQTATDWMQANWWGWCSPTQPVSRIVQVHGGVFWYWDAATGTGKFRKLGDSIFDYSTCSGFAASEHYRWTILQANAAASPVTLRIFESPEFGTAGECEADFWANGPADDLFGEYLPLCAIVVKNDGNLGVAGAIENITLSDTNYSYILVRDMRPWLHLHGAP